MNITNRFNCIKSKTYIIYSILLISHTNIFLKSDTSYKTQKGSKMITSGDKLDIKSFRTLPNGIQFLIVKTGSTNQAPLKKTVTVDYTGWLLKGTDTVGTKFDSSIDRGQNFKFQLGLGHVISGWDIMVADMKIGEKRIVILPPAYGYGSRGAGAVIPANATLIFEIELLSAN